MIRSTVITNLKFLFADMQVSLRQIEKTKGRSADSEYYWRTLKRQARNLEYKMLKAERQALVRFRRDGK